MSRHAYMQSKQLMTKDWDFSALVMAAMKKADDDNSIKLAFAFPAIWDELVRRYDAPGGYLGTEVRPNEMIKDSDASLHSRTWPCLQEELTVKHDEMCEVRNDLSVYDCRCGSRAYARDPLDMPTTMTAAELLYWIQRIDWR